MHDMNIMNISANRIAETRVENWSERADSLLESERHMVSRHTGVDTDLPTIAVWPSWRDEDGLRLVGWCPVCGWHHVFVLNADPTKLADGCKSFKLIVRDEPMPLDLALSITSEAIDLHGASLLVQRQLTYFEKINGLEQARKQVGRRTEISRDMLEMAVHVLVASGAVGETLARASANGASDLSAVIEWIDQQPGKTFGQRLAAGIKRAKLAVAKRELL